MDGRSFDDLTRALATGTSRRRLLRGALAALGGVLATGQVAPAGAACPPDQIARPRTGCVCKSTGRPPNGAGCPCPTGQTRCGERCLDTRGDLANCGGCGIACPPSSDPCLIAVCRQGVCTTVPAPAGTPCEDGDRCTTGDACDGAGRCVGVPTACDDGRECTASACDAATGACVQPLLEGWCLIDGACEAAGAPDPTAPCRRCDPAQATDAWSNAPLGASCADGDRCDGDEACDGAGACQPGVPVACPDPDQCHDTGVCDPATGECRYAPKLDGFPCDDGDACTTSTCQDGVCVGQPTVSCNPLLLCNRLLGCDPASGQCVYEPADEGEACGSPAPLCQERLCRSGVCVLEPLPVGTACDDDDPCNGAEACDGLGACQPGVPIRCAAPRPCEEEGACNQDTGKCEFAAKPDGAACEDGNLCTVGDTCRAGVCVAGSFRPCDPPAVCQLPQGCDPATGECIYWDADDGYPCGPESDCHVRVCQSGACALVPKPAGTLCDNGLSCAEGAACQADGTCAGGTVRTDACLIAGVCYLAGDPNPASPCQVCDPAQATDAWTDLPAGTPCDDGLACTEDAACQADGACTGAVQADACLIAGVCYEDGAPNPATPCQICDPAQATETWTPGAAGAPCDDGLTCTTSTCQADGSCTGPVRADACRIDGACYAADEIQPGSLCFACVPRISQQFWIGLGGVPCSSPCLTGAMCNAGFCDGDVAPDTCAIGPACYPAGAHDPARPCWVCDPIRDAYDWSRPILGTYCVIDTACYPAGAPNPANPCQVCDPTQRTNAWSHAPTGIPCETTCQSGGVCSRGMCGGVTIAGGACAIDGACYAAGDRHPFSPCLACDPTVRQDRWTPLSDDTPCTNHCLANATSTCQNAVCVGETVVACPQPPNLPLCQELVCDPATGGCVKAGVHLREDRQGCETCIRCESGICITTPLPVDCGDPAFGSCQVCDPVRGTCVPAPAGTDCGSTCTTPQTCDSSGVCQSGSPNPGGVCLNVGECPARVCDTATARCIESGANDGNACGADGCHECRDGRCVLRPCGDCQRCDPATETCLACEPCCDGRCDWLPCDGQCCAPGLECGRLAGLSDLVCVLPCANERCGGICCAPFQSCCSPGSANETCGYPCGGGCFQTPGTCCGTFGEFVIRCGDDEICCSTSPTGCCGSHQVCRINGCAPV